MRFLLLVLTVALIAVGCGSETNDFTTGGGFTPSPSVFPSIQPSIEPEATPEDPKTRIKAQRKIVKDANITLRVKQVEPTANLIRTAVEEAGGYIANSDLKSDDTTEATLQAKIPAERLESFLTRLPEWGVVLSRTETGQDMTDQYFDSQARIRNLKREEERLLDIVKGAAELKDLLELERELSRVRGEIEGLQGNMNLIDYQVSFSTVALKLVGPKATILPTAPDFWDLSGTVGNAFLGLKMVIRFALKVAIYMIAFLPLALPLYFIAKRAASKRSTSSSDV